MNWWQVVLMFVGFVYLVGASGFAGALWEREALQNKDGERGPAWWWSLLASSLAWPVVGLLWGRSRPVPAPPQPPWQEELHEVRSDLAEVVQVLRAHDPFKNEDPLYRGHVAPLSRVWQDQPDVVQASGMMVIDKPATLALQGHLRPGQKVLVKSLGYTLVRGEMFWSGQSCQCRYNFSGFPVVVCRMHRSDLDPQGEPDESEGSVGR